MECVHDHCHVVPFNVTPGGFTRTLPTPQRFAAGCVFVITPFALPHDAAGARRCAAHVAVVPPPTPAHVHVTLLLAPYLPAGNVTVTGDGVPAEQSGVAGPVAVYG